MDEHDDLSKQLVILNKDAGDIKTKIEHAKGQLTELQKQLDVEISKLTAYGATPDTAPEIISQLKAEMAELYTQARVKIEEIKNATATSTGPKN